MEARICFIGDSFVNGTGDPEYSGWPGRVCRTASRAGHDVTCYNLGVRGATSRDILSWWEAETGRRLPQETPGRLVFSFGANDTTLEGNGVRVPEKDSVKNAGEILRRAGRNRPVLMVGPPPISEKAQNERIENLSAALAAVCESEAIPYLDVFTPLLRSEVWGREILSGDGAHPSSGGYEKLAALVTSWSGWQKWFD